MATSTINHNNTNTNDMSNAPYKEEDRIVVDEVDYQYDDDDTTEDGQPLSDDDLRALTVEADQSLKLAQEMQTAALLHLYHSDSSATQTTTGPTTTSVSPPPTTLDAYKLLADTGMSEGGFVRLATALSYYKESTLHMSRYQHLKSKISSAIESSRTVLMHGTR